MASHKSDSEIITTFHEQVNMTVDELEKWLDSPESERAGTGVGHDSGRRIVEILRKNPEKKADGYDEDDIAHMRKVVAYNTRHLAQEDHLKETKTVDELEKTKSTISLRNWGHDPVKVKKQEEGGQAKDSDAKESNAKESEPKDENGATNGTKRKRSGSVEAEDDGHSKEDEPDKEEDGKKKPAKRGRPAKAAPKKRRASVSDKKADEKKSE